MKGTIQKRIALLIVAVLFLLALIPAFYPVEDEVLSKGAAVYRAYGQPYIALNTAYDFDRHLGWTRIASTLDTLLNLPSVHHESIETRAPPA